MLNTLNMDQPSAFARNIKHLKDLRVEVMDYSTAHSFNPLMVLPRSYKKPHKMNSFHKTKRSIQKISKIDKLSLEGSFVGIISTLEKISKVISSPDTRFPGIDLTVEHMKLLLCGESFDGARIEAAMKKFAPFFEDLNLKIHDGDYFKSYMSNLDSFTRVKKFSINLNLTTCNPDDLTLLKDMQKMTSLTSLSISITLSMPYKKVEESLNECLEVPEQVREYTLNITQKHFGGNFMCKNAPKNTTKRGESFINFITKSAAKKNLRKLTLVLFAQDESYYHAFKEAIYSMTPILNPSLEEFHLSFQHFLMNADHCIDTMKLLKDINQI